MSFDINKDKNFYGRTKGKSLSPMQEEAVNDILPNVEFFEKDVKEEKFFEQISNFKKIVLDIGFGHGESMFNNIINNKDTMFLGAEIFVNGYASLLSKVKKYEEENQVKLENFRIFTGDAVRLIEAMPENILNEILLYFPDPWHKKRHNKRRFVSSDNLKTFARILKKDGVFKFASDIDDYNVWTLLEVFKSRLFEVEFKENGFYNNEPDGWAETKYQKKAKREGRDSKFFEFKVRK